MVRLKKKSMRVGRTLPYIFLLFKVVGSRLWLYNRISCGNFKPISGVGSQRLILKSTPADSKVYSKRRSIFSGPCHLFIRSLTIYCFRSHVSFKRSVGEDVNEILQSPQRLHRLVIQFNGRQLSNHLSRSCYETGAVPETEEAEVTAILAVEH